MPQNGEWVLTKVGIGNHMYLTLLHCWYQRHQKLLQHVKKKLMFPLTHLSFKIFPTGTAFDVVFVDSPIFNINIVDGASILNWWKYSITTIYSEKGGIDTTNWPHKIIGQWKCMSGFIVNYHPPPNNKKMMITSMCSFHQNDDRKFHNPQNINSFLQVLKALNLECTCSAELDFFA